MPPAPQPHDAQPDTSAAPPAAASAVASAPGRAAPGAAAWHALTPQQCLQQAQAGAAGLGLEQARARLQVHGPNRLPAPRRPGPLRRLAAQLHSVLIYVLLAAAAVTLAMGHTVDALVIAGVVLLNTAIGFLQEGKAERALQAIRGLLAPRALVLRDGHAADVDAAELVPGDIVLLAAGDRLPADVRLLSLRSLAVDESALTGESVPVDKQPDAVAADAALADRTCMAYAGTLVTQGTAQALVVATGAATEVGRIGHLLETVQGVSTPLLRQMAGFGRTLTGVILVLVGLLSVVGVAVHGMELRAMFVTAVAVAVAAIPEGLPAIMTIAMAIGVQRMAARHAVVRRLPAVEALGSVTVICSDKTGTLTRNEMTVQALACADGRFQVEGAGYAPHGALRRGEQVLQPDALAQQAPALAELALAALLCNDAVLREQAGHWELAGDPTEGALLALAMKAGLEPRALRARWPRRDAIPFDPEQRYMATLHEAPQAGHAGAPQAPPGVVFIKGAPERLLAMCPAQRSADGGAQPLDAGHWQALVRAQAAAGRRVLALARLDLPALPGTLHTAALQPQGTAGAGAAAGPVLLGIVGIIDPPREEAVQAVAQCRAAGIRVAMITGDHPDTAATIAAQLGLGPRLRAVTGQEVQALDDAALQALAGRADVFARASPEHKLRLVRALQAAGEVVAMTGDGVNDAPALKQADVGVAMGRKGTEAAKQAGAIVLGDDNFASIAHAVEEGRTVYDNLRKTVTFLLPINGGEAMSLMLAVMLGLSLPILPTQILWVNMVSSIGLALVLAFEPPEPDVMRRPPRPPGEALLTGFVAWRIAFVSALFSAGIFGLHELAQARGASEDAARTVAVNALVAMEVFYLFSVRHLRQRGLSWRGARGTPRVLAAVGAVFALQCLFTYAPFMNTLFRTEPLSLAQGLACVAAGVAVLLVLEAEKALRRLRARRA